MVSKKKVVSELKQLNEQLDKHLPKVKFDSVNLLRRGGASETDVEVSLLASNIVDLRTEVALLRKNLTNDVESMTLKIIEHNNKTFFKQISSFYTNSLVELKQSFGGYVRDIVSEVSELKAEVSKIALNLEDFEDFKRGVDLELKSIKEKLINLDKKIDGPSKKVVGEVHQIAKKVGLLEKNLSVKNSFLEKNMLNLNKKIIDVDMQAKEKLLSKSEPVLNEKVNVESNSLNLDGSVESRARSNINKLLEIDKKLAKLESLR